MNEEKNYEYSYATLGNKCESNIDILVSNRKFLPNKLFVPKYSLKQPPEKKEPEYVPTQGPRQPEDPNSNPITTT